MEMSNVMKKLLIFAFMLLTVFAYSQQKFALVIGNGDYTGISRLRNPVNDANDMAEALRSLGFNVDIVLNGDIYQMETAAMNLRRMLGASRDSYGFFYYAGHGVQSGGVNYLIPIDASNIQSENHLRQRAFSVQTLLENLSEAGNELNIIVLDACRDNPFGWARSGSRGLSVVSSAPAGSIIMYATSANSTAEDGIGYNGLFTSQLLNNIRKPELSIRDIFDKTGEDVYRISNGRQLPELSIRYFGASAVYLGSQPATTPSANRSFQEPDNIPDQGLIPIEFHGTWVHGNTTINFTADSWSVSWPSDNTIIGYSVSALSCTAVMNTSNQNQSFQYGYRIRGVITSSTIPTLAVDEQLENSYFFGNYGRSMWNSGSSASVIYQKQ